MSCARATFATLLVLIAVAPATAQSSVHVELAGGAALIPAHAYLFEPRFDRSPPRPSREALGPLAPLASLRVLFADWLSVRADVEIAPHRTFSVSSDEIIVLLPSQMTVRTSSDLSAGYHTLLLQPAIELAPRSRVRPWVGAGLSLRWFDEQQRDTVLEVPTGASSVFQTHRREREEAFVTSAGVRVDVSPRWFVAGSADVRFHRLGVSYNAPITPRSDRVQVLTAIGARF